MTFLASFLVKNKMIPNSFYHIYNRGNNKQKVYFNDNNYIFFLKKIRKHLSPHIDLLAYCLMPNHFHILAYTKKEFEQTGFSKDLRIMLSSYTRAINKQENRVGSLFQQNTKIKPLQSRGTTWSGATTLKRLATPLFVSIIYTKTQ